MLFVKERTMTAATDTFLRCIKWHSPTCRQDREIGGDFLTLVHKVLIRYDTGTVHSLETSL
jgi:hypothetical protein